MSSVVGLPQAAAIGTSKKAQAAAKKQSFAASLPSKSGIDPTITTVVKKEIHEDEASSRPNKEVYDVEQSQLKVVIDALMAKQVRSNFRWIQHLVSSRPSPV
jgi:hypothetical protein